QGGGVGGQGVVDVLVAQAALVEADYQGAGVVDAGAGGLELGRGRKGGRREREDCDNGGGGKEDPADGAGHGAPFADAHAFRVGAGCAGQPASSASTVASNRVGAEPCGSRKWRTRAVQAAAS